MKLTLTAIAVLGLAFAVVAGAQDVPTTPRAMGMGNAVIGVADDAGAWSQNPAGLGALHVSAQDGKDWGNDAIVAIGEVRPGDDTALAINWSGWNPTTTMGVGAGYGKVGGTTAFGIGFGMGVQKSMFSWGADVMRLERGGWDKTVFDLGAMYRIMQPGEGNTRVGLKISDVGNATDAGPQFGIGVGWPATEDLLVAVDLVDVFGKSHAGPFINGGVQYDLGQTKEWRARAGMFDTGDGHKLTLGLGVNLAKVRLDAGYMDTNGSSWLVGAGFNF